MKNIKKLSDLMLLIEQKHTIYQEINGVKYKIDPILLFQSTVLEILQMIKEEKLYY